MYRCHDCISLTGSALHSKLSVRLFAVSSFCIINCMHIMKAVQQLLDPAFQLLFPNESSLLGVIQSLLLIAGIARVQAVSAKQQSSSMRSH